LPLIQKRISGFAAPAYKALPKFSSGAIFDYTSNEVEIVALHPQI
jgi:hypothetical protein